MHISYNFDVLQIYLKCVYVGGWVCVHFLPSRLPASHLASLPDCFPCHLCVCVCVYELAFMYLRCIWNDIYSKQIILYAGICKPEQLWNTAIAFWTLPLLSILQKSNPFPLSSVCARDDKDRNVCFVCCLPARTLPARMSCSTGSALLLLSL